MDERCSHTPEVSVIVTAYNVAPYIGRAIKSALSQEGPSVEVILVDDCSTDDTWERVSEFSDPRLRKVRLPANLGPGGARNAAIALAKGRWIAILDGDDAFFPGRLARCLKRASASGADIVVDNLTVSRESDASIFPMFPSARLGRFQMLSLEKFIEGNQCFLGGYGLGYLKPIFSSAFLHSHGLAYDTEIRIGEDYLLLAQALSRGARCAVEPLAGYLYTARASSISHRLTPADIERIVTCDRKFLESVTLDPPAARAQRLRDFYLNEAYAFAHLVEGIKKKNVRDVLNALVMAPLAARHLWRPAWVRVRKLLKVPHPTQRKAYERR